MLCKQQVWVGGEVMKDRESTGAQKVGQGLQQEEVKQNTDGKRMKSRLVKMLQSW